MVGVALAIPTFIVTLILFLLFGVNLDKAETWRLRHLPIRQLEMMLISFAFEKIFQKVVKKATKVSAPRALQRIEAKSILKTCLDKGDPTLESG